MSGLRKSLGWVHRTITVLPLVAEGLLALTACRAAALIGHWPKCSLDDPKYIGPNDLLYQWLGITSDYVFGLAILSVFVWPLLMVGRWRITSARSKVVHFLIFATSYFVLWRDPWRLFE